MMQQSVVTFGGSVDEVVDSFQDADLAEEIDFGHGKRWLHRSPAGGPGEPISKLERIVTAGKQSAMSDFSVPRLVPRNPREIVFGIEIFKSNVPDESAEGFDGIDFVPLSANETQADAFIGIFGITFLRVS